MYINDLPTATVPLPHINCTQRIGYTSAVKGVSTLGNTATVEITRTTCMFTQCMELSEAQVQSKTAQINLV